MRTNRNANVNDEISVEIRKAADDALPIVLEEEFVPSVPSVEEAIIYPAPIIVSFILFSIFFLK